MADYPIRDLRQDEYEKLIEVWIESGLPYRPQGRDSKELILREMQNQRSQFIVIEKDNLIMGTVLVTHDGRKGWINRLAVRPEYRNLGIASSLMNEAEQRLKDAGIGIFACLIENWNRGSLEFFTAKGYVKHDEIIYFTKRDYQEV